MCLAAYLASDKPLPLIARIQEEPSFYVEELTSAEESVKTQFETPYIYYLGSHEGCGCGFFKTGQDWDTLGRAQAQDNYTQLVSYLKKAQSLDSKNQIYACWQGDEDTEPEFRKQVDLQQLIEKSFEFKEGTLYEIL
jgi:hypothetical protein